MSDKKEPPYEGWKEFPKWIKVGQDDVLVKTAEEEKAALASAKPATK